MTELQPLITANQPTPTGRIYSTELVLKLAEAVKNASVLLEPGASTSTDLDRVCGKVDKVEIDNGTLMIGVSPVETPSGIILSTLLGESVPLQYYTCGTATVTDKLVQDDYQFLHIGVSSKPFETD